MNEENCSIQEWHKKQAIDNFNYTWSLIDKTDRTNEDILNMIHAAHASRFHWGQVGSPLQLARGEWQISRVYSILNMPESSLLHSQQSLNYCLYNNIGDFDLAFAYEAVARSYMLKENKEEMRKYLNLALKAGEDIEKEDDKAYLLLQLKSVSL